ncbi:hypothetical protein DXG01_015434 [Tephrocybe rancida]|nr:hypothetical protein DXG01_015434 [Tephrocybe rancida]
MQPIPTPVQASFATMVAHGQPMLVFTNLIASPSTNPHEVIASTTNTADTVMKLAKNVGEMLKDVPYVKAVAGIIIQIIQIRDEIKMTKERSLELINKVLQRSKIVLDGLLSVAKSPHKDTLIRIEGQLMDYHKLLIEVLSVLKANTVKGMFNQVVNRKSRLSDVEKYNCCIDDFNTGFLDSRQIWCSNSTLVELLNRLCFPQQWLPQLMIGRDEEKSKVIDILLHAVPAHIAILGGGGMGKTTLALSILHDHAVVDKYPSQYFVSCEGVPAVLSLVGEIANTLRIPLANRDAHLLDTVISSFPAHSLLCLDNLETIWDDETIRLDLEGLLSVLEQHLGIIITMRGTQRPSRVSWSRPLLAPLQSLTYASSRKIFEMTCGPVDEFVEKLLNAVDGIPLAISLISALLEKGSESSESLWGQWAKAQSGVLEKGGSDRLSNLDTSIHLSVYGPRMQENPKAIDILAMFSMLPDGFPDDHRAMEELENCLPKGYNLHKAFLTMRRVSLVHVNEEGKLHRLRMLYPVRAFCEQRLELPDEVRDGITSYYIEKIGHFKDVTDPDGHMILPSEPHNIHAVLVQAWKQGRGSPLLADTTILFTKWSTYIGNPVEEVISLAIQGVVDPPSLHGACHSTLGQVYFHQDKLDKAEASFEHAAGLHRQAHSVLGEANDVNNLGEVYMRQNKLAEAEASFEHAAGLHQQAHAILGEANDIQGLGKVYMWQDKLADAEAAFKHAADLHRQAHSILGEANDVNNLGVVHMQWDKLADAKASFEHAADLHRQAHSVLGEAKDVDNLGKVYMQQNKLAEAETSFEHAANLYQQAHSVLSEANAANNLGRVYIQQKKLAEAEASFKHAADLHQKAHDVLGEANDDNNLGNVYMQQNKLAEAEASFKHAADLHKKAHDVLGAANDIQGLGEVYIRQGKLADAEASFRHAADFHQQAQDVLGEANDIQGLGEVYILQDELADAEASFEHAADLHRQAHSVLGEANDLSSLGKVYMQQGKLAEAETSFEHAANLHRQTYDVLGEANDIQGLVEVYTQQDRLAEAKASFEHAADLYQQVHSVRGEANANNLGEVYMQWGKLTVADASFEHAAADLHRQAHDVLGEANDIQGLGEVYMQQDKLAVAEASFEHAADLH